MNEKKIKEELKEIVTQMSKVKIEINDETNIIYDLGFDSVAMIELFSVVEEKFGFEFEFDEFEFDNIAIYKNFEDYVLITANLQYRSN